MVNFIKELGVCFKKKPIIVVWAMLWYIPAMATLILFCIFIAIINLDYKEFKITWDRVK